MAVYGEQRASMDAVLGLKALRDNLATLKPADQVLAIDLRGRDPDLVFSEVPYEKGRLFLNYLDAKFGRDRFDAFLRSCFDHFAFKSITTEQFTELPAPENLLPIAIPASSVTNKCSPGSMLRGFRPTPVLPVSSAFQPVDDARAAWLGGTLAAKKFGLDWVSPASGCTSSTICPPLLERQAACGSG